MNASYPPPLFQRDCKHCGAEFSARSRQQYCSIKCRQENQEKVKRERKARSDAVAERLMRRIRERILMPPPQGRSSSRSTESR